MPHEDILTLVNELLSRKVSSEEIKKQLQAKGYGVEDINGALARAQIPMVHPGVVLVPTVSRTSVKASGGLITTIGVFALGIVIFIGAVGGTYWYASKSLSDSNGLLTKIVLNASGTPALSNTEPAVAPPSGQLPAYTPSHTATHSLPSAITSTQPVSKPAAPAPAPSIIQQIVQDIIPPAAPTLTLTLAGNPIPSGGDAELSWTSTDATSCTASQGWSGSEPTSGSASFSDLLSDTTYTLTCTGQGGTVTQSAQVTVTVPNPGGGGGGTPVPSPSPDPTPDPTPSPDPTPDPSPSPSPSPSPAPDPGAPSIAAGCAVPSGNPGTTFYVDPVNGNDSTGDGSSAKPWKTLSTVLTTRVNTLQYVTPYTEAKTTKAYNPMGAILPGDTIELMSGNYGAISVKGVNSDFITVQAASGQTPVFTTLNVGGAAKWKFEGIKVQSLRSSYTPLVAISSNDYGPVNNIVFDHNNVSSIDDSTSWTAPDWVSNAAFSGILMDDSAMPRDSTCLSITNNSISNIYVGANMGVDQSLFANNTINNFGGDGFDYDANNIVISHNLIENARVIDANHPDAMQGQIGRGDTSDPNYTFTNVVIDGNTIYRKTIPNLPFANGLQGIDTFSLNWTNLTVTNNVVVTDTYQAISFQSVHNGLIANNTVMYDGCEGDTGAQCSPYDEIYVGSTTHDGTPTTNMIVRNNITPELVIGSPSSATTVDHNITSQKVSLTVGTTTYYYSNPGTYGDNNTIVPSLNSGFVQFDTTGLHYDLHLLSSSPALGIGSSDQAPSVDIEGNPRVSPIADGAYTSSYPAVAYEGSRYSLLAAAFAGFANFWRVIFSFFAAV
jgi:hypothetical protein